MQRDHWWYWSDCTCERFSFCPHQRLNLGPLDLYFCTLPLYHGNFWFSPLKIEEFNSGVEGLVVVLFWLDLWEIFFIPNSLWTGDLWISGPALYHYTMVTSGFHLWQFEVFNSGAEGLVMVLFWLHLWEIFFLHALGFESGTSGSLVLHSTTDPWWLLVFTSGNFRYLTLVQRDLWWYSSDWTCERFSFIPHWVLNWVPLDL